MKNKTLKELFGYIFVVIGCIALSVFLGIIYGYAGVRSGNYWTAHIISALFGFGIWCILLISRLRVTLPLLPIIGLSVFLIVFWGHYVAYDISQDVEYPQAQISGNDNIDTAEKEFDEDDYIDRQPNEQHASSFWAHLCRTAKKGGRHYDGDFGVWTHRKGFWMWWAWLMHIPIILVGGVLSFSIRIDDDKIDEDEA